MKDVWKKTLPALALAVAVGLGVAAVVLGDRLDRPMSGLCFGAAGMLGGLACSRLLTAHWERKWTPEQRREMDRAERGYMEGNTPEFAKNLFANGMMGVSPCGIIGDARCASAEMGEAFFELFCRRAVDCVKEALENAGRV